MVVWLLEPISDDRSYPCKRGEGSSHELLVMGPLCGGNSARFDVVAADLSDALYDRGLGRVFWIELPMQYSKRNQIFTSGLSTTKEDPRIKYLQHH
ncbi:hypothetical protein AVEN_41863-1 [Araneus ventricosus]|uniref:Uncharacterized protein n=1 Tax=Araneus ventricosus TaxID=182803 RepID=A0A4Y2ACI9_ARAVE|nr:hypothetical protein AVEN_41863-1 [Araneus ventricosus]